MSKQTNATNLTGTNEFVVDPLAAQGAYTTIQGAVDAASTAGGGNVYVKAGTYSETVACKNQVSISSIASPGLVQTVKITGGLTLDTTSGIITCGISGIFVEATSGIGVTTSGANSATIEFANCTFAAANGTAFQGNTNGNLYFNDCFFVSQAGQKSIDALNGTWICYNCNFQGNNTPNTVNGAVSLYTFSSINSDSFDITQGTVIVFGGFVSPPATLPALKIRTAGAGAVVNSIVTNASPASGFIVDGNGVGTSGTLFYFSLGGLNPTFTKFDPNLNLTPILALPFFLVGENISASQNAVVGRSYYSDTGAVVFTLPTTAERGDQIKFSLKAGTSWQIAQNAGQSIRVGNQITTTGVGGSVTSTALGDSVTIDCMSDSGGTDWIATSVIGNLNIV